MVNKTSGAALADLELPVLQLHAEAVLLERTMEPEACAV